MPALQEMHDFQIYCTNAVQTFPEIPRTPIFGFPLLAKEEDSEALLEQLYISRCRPRVELCLNPCHLDPEVLDVPGWQVPHLDAGVEKCLFSSTPAWRSRSDEGIRNRNFVSTLRRTGDQEVFPTDACDAVAPGNLFIAGAQMTRGVNAELRRQNSSTPRSARTSNLPVLTSTAHFPQLPSMTASISSGSSRQYITCWPWLIAKAKQAFSTQKPKRPGSRPWSGAPSGALPTRERC